MRKAVLLTSASFMSLVMIGATPTLAQTSSGQPAASATTPPVPTAPAGSVPASTTTPSASSSGGLQDIVVTARRVEESLERVPVAVTALSAAVLAQRNVNRVSDLQFSVPNLQIKPSNNFPSQPEFIIRGQRQVLYTDENVVTYVNGVAEDTRGLTLYDLANVQVLKGPQGTLFGKNSIGGAMVFTTARPTFKFGVDAAMEYGNYNEMKATAAVNIPLADDMAALRIAGQVERRDGIYKNAYPGEPDLGNRDNSSARVTLLLKPTDRIENTLVADYLFRDELTAPTVIEAAPIPPAGSTGFQIGLLTDQSVQQQSALGGGTAVQEGNLLVRQGNPFVTNSRAGIGKLLAAPNLPGITGYGSKVRTYGIANTTSVELSDSFSIKNIVGARYQRAIDYQNPEGATGYTVNALPFFAALQGVPVGTPLPGSFPVQYIDNNTNYLNRNRILSEELQLIGNFKDFKFIAGGYYSHDDHLYAVNSAFIVGPVSLYQDSAGNSYLERHGQATTKSDSYAVFAQGTYDFGGIGLEGLRLTGGVRYTWDRRDFVQSNFYTNDVSQLQEWGGNPTSCNEINSTFGNVRGVNDGVSCFAGGVKHYSAVTWTDSLEYQVTPNTLIYLANRRGYKAGNANPTTRNLQFQFFDPEKITDFELGFKSQGRIAHMPYRLNIAGFIGKYKSIQSQDILQFCTDQTACSGGFNYTDLIIFNVGKATIKGVEVEGTLKPFRDVQLDFGYSHQVAKYGKGSILPQPTDPSKPIFAGNPIDYSNGVNLDGVSFAGVPKDTFNASARYEATWVPDSFAKPALSVNYSYRGSTTGLAVQGIYKTPKFGIWGARLDLQSLFGSPMTLSFWGQNILNKYYKLACSDNLNSIGYAACKWGEPRTYGGTVSFKF